MAKPRAAPSADRRKPRARPRATGAPEAEGGAGERAARWLWWSLIALALLRGALAFMPSMWAWGFNSLRFAPPVAGWGLWAVAAAALIPALGRRLLAPARWLADPSRPAALAYAPWALVAALLAWSLPDRLYFVGDFWLRQTAANTSTSFLRSLYPQGFPLDLFLHDTAVRGLAAVLPLDAGGVARLMGGIEAALLAALGVRLARNAGLRDGAGIAAAAVVLWGGYLALFTGYNKGFAEIVLVTAAVGVFGIEAATRGSGLLAMSLALGAGLVLHRLAIALLPAAALVWILWLRGPGAGAGRRPRVLIAALVPLAALAVMAPHLGRIASRIDAANFAAPGAGGAGGLLAAALSGMRLADLASVAGLLSPLAPAAAVALVVLLVSRGASREPGSERRRARAVLAALLIPLLGFMPFFHPPQGLLRDWDGFAASGMALSLAAAWTVGEALRAGRRWAWLGVAVALGAAAPSIAWLASHTDVDRGLARIEAFLHEPPQRRDAERATLWDYLGLRTLDLGRRDQAAAAFERAAAITPSPKILREWAAVEALRGDPRHAAEIYRRLLERKPDEIPAWLEYASVSMRLGDPGEARRAADQVLRLQPDHPQARAILEALDRGEAAPRGD